MEKRHDKDGIGAGRQRLGACDTEACGCVQSQYGKERKNEKEMEEKGGMFMEKLRAKKGYICDMDGVIYWGGRLLPGVTEFVKWLQDEGKQFLFLTNNSGQTHWS